MKTVTYKCQREQITSMEANARLVFWRQESFIRGFKSLLGVFIKLPGQRTHINCGVLHQGRGITVQMFAHQ